MPFPLRGNYGQRRAQSFLLPRIVSGQSAAVLRLRGMQQMQLMPRLQSSDQPWQPLGPNQIVTSQFGDVTGRVTSIAIAPWDASGNTVYLGSTGGGVWRSNNAAASDPTTVTWQPLTDDPPAFSGINITSLSIGAVSVQPGSTPNGVVLAGTGDPNDVLDSYYGAGILRSGDGGATWTLISQSSDGFSGGLTNYSFAGDAFAGFAWSTTNTSVVVAAVTDSYDGFINNVNNMTSHGGAANVAEAGLYYSTDAGNTWYLSTIEDGTNQVIQSSQTTLPSVFPGVPATAVVWNPIRKMFYAALEFHGYYQSPDGVTWTRMANQPGAGLSTLNCPANPGTNGSNSCAISRGVLAVQPVTGDMFALTVGTSALGLEDVDEGLWRDICNAGANGCANPTVQFGSQISTTALDAANGTITDGTYNLTLAAVPNGSDTLLFAGTQDIFRCSLAAGCVWRNTTNTTTCVSGEVAPAEHAIAALGSTTPLLYFGNDGGLWRSTDGVNQTGATCSASDAGHFQNLNGGLGSLAEVTGMANSETDGNVVLAGFGVNGSAAMTNSGQTAWPQLLSGEGGQTAIDPTNPDNWYATVGPYVAIGQCIDGVNCTAATFPSAIGASETSDDQSLLFTPYILDPADSSKMIVGTCRVWRGPASGGNAWSATNAISPMLDGVAEPNCNGNALVRSLAAGGTNVQPGTGSEHGGSQVIYAGMAGLLDGGGGSVGGHVFVTEAASVANGSSKWTDLALSPVANESLYNGVFNPYFFDVSSLYADPHDPTGNTVYATIQGFGVPHLYMSTDGGADWNNISKNLPDLPLNDVLVDPNNASVVYVASDGGVFVTQNVANCESSGGQCWNILGTGLPVAPAVTLSATLAGGGFLRVGTYGRGIWQVPLLSGVPQTTMTVSPTTLTFSGQPLQTISGPQIVTVTNTGATSLTVNNISVDGDFLETDNCGNAIAANGTCQISVTFDPSTSGTQTGTLTVPANIASSQETVSLTGTGTTQSAIVVLPNNVNFGDLQVSTVSAAQQVTISNTSAAAIALTSESVTGPFAIQTNTCSSTLASNTGCTVAVVFQPTSVGTASGVLTVVSAQGTESIGLSGNGENPATGTVSPTSLVFPATQENTISAPQTVTLTNNGGVPLTGIQVVTSGDFQVINGCVASLNAQSTCTLTVQYAPHATGTETGSIQITDSLGNQIVSLSGTGTAPATDTLSPTSLTFPATQVGQSAPTQTVTLTNSGGAVLTQLSIHAVGAGFGESSNCGSALAAQSACTITVSFQPSSVGTASGQIVVADSIRSQIVALTASGVTPTDDSLTPLSLNFGGQIIATASAPQTITLSDNIETTLSGIQIQSSNPDFMFTKTCGAILTAGQSCTIQVEFEPHAGGAESGTITEVDSSRTQQVTLTGIGYLPNIALAPGTLNFGVTGLQVSSTAQTLVLSNGSTGTLTGISVAASGSFAESNNCGTSLGPQATCTVSVVFSPSAAGNQSGTVTVSSTDSAPMTAQLTGVGIGFQLVPTSSTSQTVSSGNAASYSLELTPVNGSTGTAAISCANLPPNSTCTISPENASLNIPSSIQVAIATGVGSESRVNRASLLGWLPWPIGLTILITTLTGIRRGRSTLQVSARRLLVMIVLIGLIGNMVACGKGGGLLGSSTPPPLPANSTTPPGVYTVTVSAAAGGLNKSVSLTVQVQ
ncbi:MAG TPA: choice-of-anchor D domain-containing protein [Acidobacteriaceae bacterium]|nr:choice-of-anchor D domain-containing protein [Acidobacteriaceae bacterium]